PHQARAPTSCRCRLKRPSQARRLPRAPGIAAMVPAAATPPCPGCDACCGSSPRSGCTKRPAPDCMRPYPLRCAPEPPPRLPRLHEFQLLWKTAGVARREKRFFTQDGRNLVLPVPVLRRARKAQNHHIRTEPANYPHHIGKDALASPLGESLFRRFRISEVDRAREILFRAVDPPGRQQFVRTNQPQQIALLRTNQVLPAFAARER